MAAEHSGPCKEHRGPCKHSGSTGAAGLAVDTEARVNTEAHVPWQQNTEARVNTMAVLVLQTWR
eukprot:131561-Chlamydomonas_euryale.AAC.3